MLVVIYNLFGLKPIIHETIFSFGKNRKGLALMLGQSKLLHPCANSVIVKINSGKNKDVW